MILQRLVPGIGFGQALRIALASLGVGPLLPGNPVSGSGIAYAELRRSRVSSHRAAAAAFALVIGIPAASMALLAGPTLIGSGLAAPLPAGWQGVVLFAGSLAILLALGSWSRWHAAPVMIAPVVRSPRSAVPGPRPWCCCWDALPRSAMPRPSG